MELSDDYYKRSVASAGDPARLAEQIRKARTGAPLTLGVIGGSITVGYSASDLSRTSWAAIVRDWWIEKFPDSQITLVNAGIGATGSLFGVHRVDEQLLSVKPNVVVVEFGVNDHGITDSSVGETYEGLLRKVLKQDQHPAVLVLGLMDEHGGTHPYHLPVSKHYNVPFISYRDAVWGRIEDGELTWQDISPDQVHPNDAGHAYAADLIIHYLDTIYANIDDIPAPSSYELPIPTTNNGYEQSKILTSANLEASKLGNWRIYSGRWREGWIASDKGDPLVVEVTGGYITINYVRTNQVGKGAKLNVVIDNGDPIGLDADFSGGWGDYTVSQTLLSERNSDVTHRVAFYYDDDADKEFIITGILIANY